MVALITGTTGLSPSISAQQGRTDASSGIGIQPVRKNVFMLVGEGTNITVQVGDEGVLVIDPGSARISGSVLAAIRDLCKEPLRYIIDTNAEPEHTGGNAILGKAGENLRADGLGAEIISHLDIDGLMRAQTPARPAADLPSDTFLTAQKDFYFNDEPVVILPQPAAHAKGDVIVFLRRSDVISAGEIFLTTGYPVIRVDQGGSINGELAALNRILEITVPKKNEDGGTMVIPGRGHLSDEADVAEYRDMLTIIRDRVQDLINKGMTLAQVKSARPTADYDPLYRAASGPWTTDMFVEAVYRSLQKTK